MRKLLTLIFVLCTFALAAQIVIDTSKFHLGYGGATIWLNPGGTHWHDKIDTIAVVMLVTDTTHINFAFWMNGYRVVNSTSLIWVSYKYLTRSKKPIPARLMVWMVVNKPRKYDTH